MASTRLSATSEEIRKTVSNIDKSDEPANKLFDLVDGDGSGTIDKFEFAKLYASIRTQIFEEHEKEQKLAQEGQAAKKRLKILGFVSACLFLFLGLSVAANFGTTLSVITSSPSAGVAMDPVPLGLAPLLDHETLEDVTSLTVRNTANSTHPEIASHYTIAGYDWYNKTYLVFNSVMGQKIHIINGMVFVEDPTFARGGDLFAACAGSVSCSHFKAAGVDIEAKKAELRALVPDPPASRRQLLSYWGAWMAVWNCGEQFCF